MQVSVRCQNVRNSPEQWQIVITLHKITQFFKISNFRKASIQNCHCYRWNWGSKWVHAQFSWSLSLFRTYLIILRPKFFTNVPKCSLQTAEVISSRPADTRANGLSQSIQWKRKLFVLSGTNRWIDKLVFQVLWSKQVF